METFVLSGKHTLKEAVETFFLACRVDGKKKTTLAFYQFTVGSFLKWSGDIPLESIDTFLIRKFINSLELKELKRSTIWNNIRALRTFFIFLIRDGFMKNSPMGNINKPRLPKQYPFVFEDHQVLKLLRTPNQKSWEGYRNYVILLMFLDTGIRLEELCGLNLKDINLAIRSVNILGKGDKSRLVFMGKKLTKELHKWIELRGYKAYEEALFCTKPGERLKKRNIDKLIQRMGKKAGISGTRCSPHTLRHTFATNYIRNGGDPFSLQQLLGHSDIKTCMIYVHMAGVALREAHAKYSPVDRML